MNFSLPRLFSPSFILTVAVAAMFTPATAMAFNLHAMLERGGSGPGEGESACTFCANTSTRVSTTFNGGFPAPANPVAVPPNSQISGKAFANLATGFMRGEAFAASYGHNEQHQMRFVSRFEESITISLPPTLPAAERKITVISNVGGSVTATNRATASLNYALNVHNVNAGASADNLNGWSTSSTGNPSVVGTPHAEGYGLRVTSVIPNSRVVLITAQLDGTVWAEARHTTGVGIANVSAHSLGLRIILPVGATYTSTSGVFLSSSEIDAWREFHFGTADNSGPGADVADPDVDGVVNLMEFATLTNPLVAGALPIEPTLAGGNLEFTYTRNTAAMGEVTYAVEWTDELASASWSTAGVSETILSDDGTSQRIKATLPAGDRRRFARLSVTSVAP